MVVTGLNWILPPKLSCFSSRQNRWEPDWLRRVREGVPGQVSQQFQDCCQVPGPDRADKEGGPHQAVWERGQDTVHLSAWECGAPSGLQHRWPLAVPGEYMCILFAKWYCYCRLLCLRFCLWKCMLMRFLSIIVTSLLDSLSLFFSSCFIIFSFLWVCVCLCVCVWVCVHACMGVCACVGVCSSQGRELGVC